MFDKLLSLFGFSKEEYPLSNIIEYMSPDNPVLSDMPDEWKKSWVFASREAIRLANLSVEEIKLLPENTDVELPETLQGLSCNIDHGVMLNGCHIVNVIISSNNLIEGRNAICASFEIPHEGQILIQPRPMWSGPNTESLVRWVHGYKPK